MLYKKQKMLLHLSVVLCAVLCLYLDAAQFEQVAARKALVFSSYCPEDVPKVRFGPFQEDKPKKVSKPEASIQKINGHAVAAFPDYYPYCPEIYTYKLRKAEQQRKYNGRNKFVFGPFFYFEKDLADTKTKSIKEWMKKYEIDSFADYFIALASSQKLSDEQKLYHAIGASKALQSLLQRPREYKEEACDTLCRVSCDSDYAIARLLYVLFYRSGIDLHQRYGWHKSPLENALRHDDIPLVKQLLQLGADPNRANTLQLCETLPVMKLVCAYGADIQKQHRRDDLIVSAICSDCVGGALLNFLLGQKGLRLKERPDGGNDYFNRLCTMIHFSYELKTTMIEKIEVLCKHKCRYTEESVQMLFDLAREVPLHTPWRQMRCTTIENTFDKKQKGQKQLKRSLACKFAELFKQHPRSPQRNIVYALQQRAITGAKTHIPIDNIRKQRLYQRAYLPA